MNRTKVIFCTCEHEHQDAINGKNMRFTTPANAQQKKGSFVVRCTVCGREHNEGQI